MASPDDETRLASRAKRTSPRCPATGEKGCRLVQWVSAEFLADLWRLMFKVDVRPSFRGVERFGLWRSPTGLYFFDPPRAGDAEFYAGVYRRMKLERYAGKGLKAEHLVAATRIRKGEIVLDVGCGHGAFRAAAPHARYVGIEPYADDGFRPDWLRVETLDRHLAFSAGAYDAVCAFQVLEHMEDPFEFLTEMSKAARPGGQVIIGAPHAPSASARIPNYLINAVPHHITWWTADALTAIARRAGLVDVEVVTAPWSEVDAIVYWISRMTPVKTGERFYRHAWSWHLSFALGGTDRKSVV